MTTVRYIGAYAVPVSETERKAALSCHGDPKFVAKELGSLALVEPETIGAPEDFDNGKFKQPHTTYLPYDETYFDAASLERLSDERSHRTKSPKFRVAFFLHFFDPT